MTPRLEALLSFLTTRWLSRAGLSRPRFEQAQARAIDRWVREAVPRVGAFADGVRRLQDLPKMDKASLMADFAAYNSPRITAGQVRSAMERDFRIGSLTVGASTGTSGNRGYFVISETERFRWLGNIVAKAIADLLWRRQRVAIILPQGTGLYDSANHFRQIHLRFFDLKVGPEGWRSEIEAFAPTVIVAPPKMLRHMAGAEFRLQPTRLFSAAETLDPVDRPLIEAGFATPLEQIYMATEGLLGVTCRHGTLHLAEESVHFEFEPAGDGLVTPLISSFRRETQILVRYRMNDLLRLAHAPCHCGSPLQAVDEVVGRMDDCFLLPGPNGQSLVTPDVLRNAVLTADPGIIDYRIVQTGAQDVELRLAPDVPVEVAERARTRLHALLEERGLCAKVGLIRAPMPLEVTRKLRRVERRFAAEGRSHGQG
ncbi:CoF synthetase [Palleronia caenipelagi]|uniref:CoF synthetase n=1 Tax=Palleronia caenipelagi TaxID=2489174 RepID=A0A547PP22_9RHOB|nr:CoF synthetase [Palleronia caenipelagi]TRD15794.1 CoF synthetase [Palleronia caenipelagi]